MRRLPLPLRVVKICEETVTASSQTSPQRFDIGDTRIWREILQQLRFLGNGNEDDTLRDDGKGTRTLFS
ncbi:hypothetical protein TNCV_2876491 [Trichonephila clavipes]|uniref:Uncharacterized protein n=1 Tax=Trichonephila inaurata madagascariensis TaxID=2747483 RepID=A0A8X6M5S6_9ARAC|nr:hypothetical protein TNIN_185001 [Trichonephila inaurata madagascariensis]GFV52983.1 hypothetical protein TNCV_2876491 [Trichonephila clavipes]